MNTADTLFQPLELNKALTLKNRIVMAPLTRCMTGDDLVPTEDMAAYYGRRADAGLIISEATIVSQDGQGYPNTPGLYNKEQVTAWKNITKRVHSNGGKMFAQLWHTGRVSHSVYHNGKVPMAPSAVLLDGRVPRLDDVRYEMPRAMEQEDIDRVIQNYGIAAKNAMKAGFDGVEIHGANGYLLDEFMHWDTNRRTDAYGGNVENMARFVFQIFDAVLAEVPSHRVGIRLSPQAYVNLDHDDRDKDVFEYVLKNLSGRDLAYVHTGMFSDDEYPHIGGTVTQFIRKNYSGTVIGAGGYSAESAKDTIDRGDADLIAIGRPFIANADYVSRVKNNEALVPYDESMLPTLD